MKQNVSTTVNDGLCMGCGICQDVCPKDCITIVHGKVNNPVVNEGDCIDCGRCVKACSGTGIEIGRRSKELYQDEGIKSDQYLGRYLRCYSGYSTDYNIRYHCASGGCVSQFIIWLIEKGYIDGAVVTRYKEGEPMTPEPFIARTKEDVLSGKSSKYCVVSYEGIVTEIKNTPGRYVVVGLPCHIHAFRKCMNIDTVLRERVIGLFPIFCSSNKNMDSQKYILWRYHINPSILGEFAYRDEGCLGKMFFWDKNRNLIGSPIEFLDFYRGIRAFFNVPRCNVCTDFFGELGDVCFGDLNVDDENDDPIGISSIIVRSNYWESKLKQCRTEGYLELSEIDEKRMIEAQTYCSSYKKGEGFYATWKLRKMFGFKNPQYDNLISLRPGVKAYIKAIEKVGMYYVGKHRWMWPIIKKLDKNKNN